MAPIAALAKLSAKEKSLQDEAYQELMAATAVPVPWAYEIWDAIVEILTDKDNRRRSIAAQVLSSLAKSDPERRLRRDFPKLLNVTRDTHYVTARHCLQSLGKVAVIDPENAAMVTSGLALRFRECADEKNGTLTRYDITVVLRQIHDAMADTTIGDLSLQLIATETDEKYKKKYAAVWKAK